MSQLPFGNAIRFEKVKGVGTIDLQLNFEERVYTFIGENGIGKTKLLESLFTALFFANKSVIHGETYWIEISKLPFSSVTIGDKRFNLAEMDGYTNSNNPFRTLEHHQPVVYVSAQQRGYLGEHVHSVSQLGNKTTRLTNYLDNILSCFSHNPEKLKQLNMDISLENWFIQRAQSANRYQAKEDNREVELNSLLVLLNKIDQRIDPAFLEISGDNRIFIQIEGQKRELSTLSSGFMSILKMMQAIIAGYSYFTNEVQIANVRGIVLIDEIESHLHNQWQANIIPFLKELFPNTTFFITTHSSLVISQLREGEAYRLQRKDNGIVYANMIEHPSKVSFIDLLNDAFGVDLNQLKIDRAGKDGQKEAKAALLNLVQAELNRIGAKHG